jgi:hypothetical protein
VATSAVPTSATGKIAACGLEHIDAPHLQRKKPVSTHQDTRIPMSLEFSYRVLHTAVHGLAPHKVFYPAQVWWKPWEAGEIGMRAAAGSALGQSLGKRPPVSSIMLSFASCGTKTVEASFGVGATR